MGIEITEEMLAAARKRKEADDQLNKFINVEDPGDDNVCISCQ